MKINWRLIIALVAIVGVSIWAVSAVLPRSYNGANLTFSIGSGTVTINNPSDAPVASQLVGKTARSFVVSSRVEGLSGSSVRQGTGASATQLFQYASPPGISEFSVARGNDVNFVSTGDTRLQATVKLLSEGETTSTLVVAALIVIGGLYYISRTTEHRWIKTLLRREVPTPMVVAPAVTTAAGDPNRGTDGRMYSNYGTKD
jgi:hypothetical protein